MRVLFVVLVLLNLLALASIQGWLGTSAPEGEPERLSNQLNPDRIVLRPAEAPARPPAAEAPAAPADAATKENGTAPANGAAKSAAAPTAPPPPPEACVALTGLTEVQADALVQAALAPVPGVRSERKTSATPSAWWVRIPPPNGGGREAAERRVAELRAQGITDLFIVNDPGPNQFAVSLGLFKTEAKAQQHLAALQDKNVRGAGVVTRSTTVHRIEVRGPSAALDAIKASRTVRRSGATIAECTP